MPKMTMSFKQTTRDTKLYLYVINQEEKSEFIKKALEFYIKHLEEEEKKAKK